MVGPLGTRSLVFLQPRLRRFPFEQHRLLVQIHGCELSVAVYFQCRWFATMVVAGQHAGINEHELSANAGPDAGRSLNCVTHDNVCGVVSPRIFSTFGTASSSLHWS